MEVHWPSQRAPVLRPSYKHSDALADFYRLRDLRCTLTTSKEWQSNKGSPVPHKLGLTSIANTGQRFANYFHFSDRSRAKKPGKEDAQTMLRRHSRGETQRISRAIERMRRSAQLSRMNDDKLLALAIKSNSALFSIDQFPAHVAKSLADAFVAVSVLDFCAGWGDRLSGFLASSSVKHICLVDPRRSTPSKYTAQLRASKRDDVTLRVFTEGAEHAVPRMRGNQFDVILTSPPYAHAEIYDSAGKGQAIDTVATEDFVERWLGPIMRDCMRTLRSGGVLIVNIADSPTNDIIICAKVLKYMKSAGCEFVGTIGLRKRGTEFGLRKSTTSEVVAEPMYVWCAPGAAKAVRARYRSHVRKPR